MTTKSLLRILVTVSAFLAMQSAWTQDGWQEITDASEPFVDGSGTPRAPSCSGGPVLDAGGFAVPADHEFSFFFRGGDPAKLAIAFDGGGACWDGNTCVGSALSGDPIYDLVVDESAASLNAVGGIGDRNNRENPLRNHTQVFIPYCTGDLHAGSSDTVYPFTAGGVPDMWTIRHRGYDNVLAVLKWVTAYYTEEVGHPPKELFLTGASAGGYGVRFAYPAFDASVPSSTRIRVLTDSAATVINQHFYDTAVAPGGVWGLQQNIAPQLASAFASGPDSLGVAINHSLGSFYPRTRFGEYTRAFDAVQIFYLNVMRNPNAPWRWTDPTRLFFAGLDWTLRARTNLALSALTTSNYRFYLARGTGHTILADDRFYSEASAGGIRFVDWVDDMINRRSAQGGDWKNASCVPNCLPD